jgi:DNA processing protein
MARSRGVAVDVRALGDGREWLALQAAGALRPRECTDALRAGLRPGEILARLARVPGDRWLRHHERRLAELGAVLVPWGSPGYPPRLRDLSDAPPVLAVRGDPAALAQTSVAIVGSRAASAYGREVARRVAGELASAGVVVVSGLAFGIDAAAHEAAIAAGGRTVAVQACGVDRVYPAAHRELADRIAQSGAVVSEFALGTPPHRFFFPLRNRLISGLARALIVVEARERSGSLVTARHAADQGVDVFAVPGPITGAHHVGTNRLLRDGAAPLLESEDVLEALAWPSTPRRTRAQLSLSESARALLDALRGEPASGDELARRLGVASAALAPPLVELELAGAIARDRDGRWRALM